MTTFTPNGDPKWTETVARASEAEWQRVERRHRRWVIGSWAVVAVAVLAAAWLWRLA